jgi:hypothetical protein
MRSLSFIVTARTYIRNHSYDSKAKQESNRPGLHSVIKNRGHVYIYIYIYIYICFNHLVYIYRTGGRSGRILVHWDDY